MSSQPPESPTLGLVGGTGPEGRGLACRFATLGLAVIIGSRSDERAGEIAREMTETVPHASIRGTTNINAAADAEIVVLTIPYAGIFDTLPPLVDALQNKIVISSIAPIEFRNGRPFALRCGAGSAAQEVQKLLPDARVVSAFQTVDAHQLSELNSALDTDVIVCSDDADARHTVMALAHRLPGVRALSGGRLAASRYVEEVTALLITLNRIYKAHSSIKIVGIEHD